MARVLPYKDVSCGQCGRVFVTKWQRKLFCDPCGVARRNKSSERVNGSIRDAKNPALAKIAEESAKRSTSMVDSFSIPRKYQWTSIITTEYSINSSKNRRWSNNGKGVVYLTSEVRKYQNDLILLIKESLRNTKIYHAKLWIGIFVQKPNHRSDAINVVDTICDAIKKAVDLDDRWFAIERVDWEVIKKDPKIYIKISQEATEDMLVCSHCGVVQPVILFPFNKGGTKFGHARVCRKCKLAIDREASVIRAALGKLKY